MALKEVCTYNLDVELKTLVTLQYAVEAPTTQEIALDAEAMEGSEGEAQSEASATSQASRIVHQNFYAYSVNLSDCSSSQMTVSNYFRLYNHCTINFSGFLM